VLLFSAAIWGLHRECSASPLKAVFHAIGRFPVLPGSATAPGLVAAGWGTLTAYVFLTLRNLNQSLDYVKIAMAAFVGALPAE
jgi:hypothetical protein